MISKAIFLLLGLGVLTIFGCNTTKHVKESEQKNKELKTRTWVSEKNRTTEVTVEEMRFYELTKNIQRKFEADSLDEVQSDIKEIKQLLPNYTTNWNYGNAVHKMNIVEGRIALQNGNIKEAKKYLILAGKTTGSPQLNSFGPNMSLAKELLEKGEKEIVMEYLNLCGQFWESDSNKLKNWTEIIQKGGIPDFGANMIF